MKNLLLAMVMVLFTIASCDKADDDFIKPASKPGISNGIPVCISRIIENIKKEHVRNPPAKIYRYNYHGKTVYYVTAYCCDIPSDLYDHHCNLICHPDGGFTGEVDANCADFFEQRSDEKLIWMDERK